MAMFQDKVVVVTGASEGIGRALCLELAPQRPKLVLAARNEARLHEAAEQCQDVGAQVLVVPTDVTDEAACKTLIDKTVDHFRGIDVLVNNAGGTIWARFDEVSDLSIFDGLMKLNYMGGVYCTYHALPHLKDARGILVGVSSLAGMSGVPCRTAYAATKHAQFGFFDSLRIELDGTGVDVVMIAPDFVVTQIHKRALDGNGEPLGESPLQESKVMSAQECASLIVDAMTHRRRLVLGSFRGKAGRWLKLVYPKAIDNIARRAIESGR